MRSATAARASRGYLLAWLGALAGAAPAVLFPVAIVRAGGCTSPGGCGVGGGLVVGVFAAAVGAYAAMAGPPVGMYVALRLAGREAAGLTFWTCVLIALGLIVVNSVVGPALEGGPLDDMWAGTLGVAIVTMPLSARFLAIRIADVLRPYR